jgi:hypothetical protein
MAQAFIPWKSQVQQAFATGQLNERQMEKQMAAGTFGEVQETYEETGRQADRAARNRSMDIQENAQNAQIGLGKYQTAVSAVGAVGMLGLGYSAVKNAGLIGGGTAISGGNATAALGGTATIGSDVASTASGGNATAALGGTATIGSDVASTAGTTSAIAGGTETVGATVGAGLGTEAAVGAGVGAEAAAATTSIWSTIGSYISDALLTILTW